MSQTSLCGVTTQSTELPKIKVMIMCVDGSPDQNPILDDPITSPRVGDATLWCSQTSLSFPSEEWSCYHRSKLRFASTETFRNENMTWKREIMGFLVILSGGCSQHFTVLSAENDHRALQSTGGQRSDHMAQIVSNRRKAKLNTWSKSANAHFKSDWGSHTIPTSTCSTHLCVCNITLRSVNWEGPDIQEWCLASSSRWDWSAWNTMVNIFNQWTVWRAQILSI